MRREDMERLVFLYLCDDRERNILLGKLKMQFEDFLKFEYWTKKLEFWEYNKSLWNRYGEAFQKDLKCMRVLTTICPEERADAEQLELEKLEVWEQELEHHLKKHNVEWG